LFFFQAEDGIRDPLVTGVQTCALPILGGGTEVQKSAQTTLSVMTSPEDTFGLLRMMLSAIESGLDSMRLRVERRNALAAATPSKIGRASCRERGEREERDRACRKTAGT